MKPIEVHKSIIKLVSAICRNKASATLYELGDRYFITKDEKDFFIWIKNFYQQHKRFPQPSTVLKQTGTQLVKVIEPVSFYLDEVRRRALFYSISNNVGRFSEALGDKDPDVAFEQAKKMVRDGNTLFVNDRRFIDLHEAVDNVDRDFEIARHNSGLRGITTGWPEVDAATDGWQGGDLISWVGRPGTAKTFMMLHQARAAWAAGKSVLFVSMEMTDLQITRRLIALHLGMNPNYIKTGRMSSDLVPEFKANLATMKNDTPFNIVAGNFKKSTEAIKGLADELCPDIIFADASYLLTPEKKRQGSSGRRESVSDVVEELTALAKSINRPIVQSVQFNRQAERTRARGEDVDTRNPISHLSLAKIGETDVVGQASSVVIGIELGDPPHEKNQRYLGILKGREGEQGFWKCNFRFDPVDFSIINERNTTRANTNTNAEDDDGEETLDPSLHGIDADDLDEPL